MQDKGVKTISFDVYTDIAPDYDKDAVERINRLIPSPNQEDWSKKERQKIGAHIQAFFIKEKAKMYPDNLGEFTKRKNITMNRDQITTFVLAVNERAHIDTGRESKRTIPTARDAINILWDTFEPELNQLQVFKDHVDIGYDSYPLKRPRGESKRQRNNLLDPLVDLYMKYFYFPVVDQPTVEQPTTEQPTVAYQLPEEQFKDEQGHMQEQTTIQAPAPIPTKLPQQEEQPEEQDQGRISIQSENMNDPFNGLFNISDGDMFTKDPFYDYFDNPFF